MMETIIVIDDFYQNPDQVRQFALRQEFFVKGNFPGPRSAPVLNDSITNWRIDPYEYNGAYQFSIQGDVTLYMLTLQLGPGVVYLTPHAPPANAGTAFFRHLQTGIEFYPEEPEQRRRVDEDSSAWDRWAVTDQIGNRLNRLISFRGARFHSSQGHFGNSKEDARLFQTFFNTTY